jgi:AbrB family looped-hinge helix DNA binding protein
MKPTGIVRRIDELGRIVIPKEIRRTMKLNEGAPLEIFTDKDGSITLKPYKTTTTLKVRYIIEKEMEIEVDTTEVDFDNTSEVINFVKDKIPSNGDPIKLNGVWEDNDCLYRR